MGQIKAVTASNEQLPHTDEYWLAMAALDQYPIDDGLPKSTAVVYRIHQLGHQLAVQAAMIQRLTASFCEAHQPPHSMCACCVVVHLDDQLRARETALRALVTEYDKIESDTRTHLSYRAAAARCRDRLVAILSGNV